MKHICTWDKIIKGPILFRGGQWVHIGLFKTYKAWETAKQIGYLTGDQIYIFPEFINSYHWMMKQMEKEISHYSNEYPVWLWTERPDLRKSGHLEKGTRGILLKVRIDSSRVLLSDFLAWHSVFYNSYVSVDEEDEINNSMNQSLIEESWQRIFDFDFLKSHPDWGVVQIQGVTGKVSINEITLVKDFIGR